MDLIAFTQEMDRCWMEGRFDDLSRYIADDVVMVAPGGKQRLEGLGAAISSYREFIDRCQVSDYRAHNHVVTLRGPAAIVEYDWDMAWSDGGVDQRASGREILALARRGAEWRVVWRTQLPT